VGGAILDADVMAAHRNNEYGVHAENPTTLYPFAKATVVRVVLLAMLIGIVHFIGTLPPQSLVANAVTLLSFVIAGVFALSITTARDCSISQLRNTVAREERLSADAVDRYRPAVVARVDDITAAMVDLFRQIPGVVRLETRIAVEKPPHRIIHLRDMHLVPRHIVALELRQSLGREPTSRECEMNCQRISLKVERVQLELLAILRCLIRHHGLTKVFVEGMLVADHDGWREWIDALRVAYSSGLSVGQSRLKVSKQAIGGSALKGKELPQDGNLQPLETLNTDEPGLAEMGAPLHLAIRGELVEIFPLDDFTLLEANPVSPTGELQHDCARIEARHDAQIRCLTKEGGVAVVILGGAHDLSESVQRIAGGKCEYIRVTSKRFREMCPPELK
jgi:hypothetical protein